MHDPVITPEAVVLDLEPATIGSRSVAAVLDYTIIFSGLLVLAAAQAAIGVGEVIPGWVGLALLLLVMFALQFGYPIGFETLWRGRTPGKAALGLRVVTLEGAPVGFRHAAVRSAVGAFEVLGTLGAVALIASFASPRGQRLGDMAGGTMVVRERTAGGTPEAMRFDPPHGLEGYVRMLDVSRLDTADYATVRDLLRRPLPQETRDAVARSVAAGLLPRVQPPPPAGVPAATWLWCVAAAMQARGATPYRPAGAGPTDGSGPIPPPSTGGGAGRGWPPPVPGGPAPAAPPAPGQDVPRSRDAGTPPSPGPGDGAERRSSDVRRASDEGFQPPA